MKSVDTLKRRKIEFFTHLDEKTSELLECHHIQLIYERQEKGYCNREQIIDFIGNNYKIIYIFWHVNSSIADSLAEL